MKILREFMPLILSLSVLWIVFFIIDKGMNKNDDLLKAQLTRIIDGDTVIVTIPDWPSVVGNNIPVRIANIDAPERNCVNEWNRSREHLISLVGSSETVELRNIERGKYFRLIAEVFVDGKSLGDLMVSDGYAFEYGQGKIWC